MNPLQRNLQRLLSGAPAPRARTKLVVVWPDGSEYTIRRWAGAWWWSPAAGSTPLSAAIENVEAAGGRVERRPVG